MSDPGFDDDVRLEPDDRLEPIDSGPTPVRQRTWLALGLLLAICGAYWMAMTAVASAFFIMDVGFPAAGQMDAAEIDAWVEQVQSHGTLLTIATFVGVAVVVPLTVLFAGQVSNESARKYLGLRWPPWKSLLVWVAAALTYVFLADGLVWLLRIEVDPSFMLDAYRSAGVLPLFWAALIVGAPLAEEFFFRGFMFSALRETPLRPLGAAILSSLAWALIHTQYQPAVLVIIFFGGLLIAAARQISGSLVPCLAMHAAWNLVATIQLATAN